jgi:hypothetical protein
VITEAGNDPLGGELRPDAQGFLSITSKVIAEDFAQDLAPKEKEILAATQGPTNAAAFGATVTTEAWKTNSVAGLVEMSFLASRYQQPGQM